MKKHDKTGKHGFDIDPIQLAHDLTMLKLYKSEIPTDDWVVYDLYTKTYDTLKAIVDDKTRYDDNYTD